MDDDREKRVKVNHILPNTPIDFIQSKPKKSERKITRVLLCVLQNTLIYVVNCERFCPQAFQPSNRKGNNTGPIIFTS